MMKKFLATAVIALAAVFTCDARVYEWTWRMPGEVYRNLEFTIRAGVDRATKIFDEAYEARRHGRLTPQQQVTRFRAAAAEWKKVQIQAEGESADTSLLGYVAFMQAFARHLARDRNEAVRLYLEMLDLYGDEKWIAANATYWMGRAKIDMGDTKAGDIIIDELVDDDACAKEPVLALALYDRGCRLFALGKYDEAIECWERVLANFKEIVHNTWSGARWRLQEAYALTQNFQEMERIILVETGDDKKKRAQAILDSIGWKIHHLYHSHLCLGKWFIEKYEKPKERKEQIEKFNRAFLAWATGASRIMEEGGLVWESRTAIFRLQIGILSRNEISKSAGDLAKSLMGEKNTVRRSKYARDAAITLADNRFYEAAHLLVPAVDGAPSRAWLKYEIDSRAGEWKAAALDLEECLSQGPDADLSVKAKYTLGWVYRDRTKEYDKAIKIYVELADPPRTLWELQYAYRGANKKKESYAALAELTSMFPDYAAKAVYQTARYREEDGEKETAIALYKRLLRQPEWKKTWESSQAHQQLERLGVATGGAVINEVH